MKPFPSTHSTWCRLGVDERDRVLAGVIRRRCGLGGVPSRTTSSSSACPSLDLNIVSRWLLTQELQSSYPRLDRRETLQSPVRMRVVSTISEGGIVCYSQLKRHPGHSRHSRHSRHTGSRHSRHTGHSRHTHWT